MKKWKRIIAIALAAVAIAMILPMGSVQALKKRPATKLEIGTQPERETETEAETQQETETQQEVETEEKSEVETLLPNPEEITKETDPENGFHPNGKVEKMEGQISQAAKGISVKIEDDIQKDLTYQSNQCVKKAVHTITLTRNEKILLSLEPFSKTADIYESISYTIYQQTDEGEICLQEGSLEIPQKGEKCSINKIETEYTQAGDYGIRVKGKWEEEIEVEFACYHFSIEKKAQKLFLRKQIQNLDYGDSVLLNDLVNLDMPYVYQEEYEITEISGEKNNILEIGESEAGVYLKAIGLNGVEEGRTTVTIHAKENAFMEASNEQMLTVIVNPVNLTITAETDVSEVYMYDALAVKVQIWRNGKEIMDELLKSEKRLFVNFIIKSNEYSCEASSKNLAHEKGSPSIFYIPVKKEFFKEFSKGADYTIEISLKCDNEIKYIPYKAEAVTKHVKLLGRRAAVELSAEHDGVYDYRTYYGERQPFLMITIKDTTDFESPIEPDADEIVYHIHTTDSNVASVDDFNQYTTKDEKIPININGVGTATITVTADGSSVYTVKSSSITVTVKNSPLYDEDFVISVAKKDTSEVQEFVGDVKQTGFEKWQDYLKEHNGWINGSVWIRLTDTGARYYDSLNLVVSDGRKKVSEQLSIGSDRKKAIYTFYAENKNTKANTQSAEDSESGVRSFELGIDTIAPVIAQFNPSTDYYDLTSTAEQQNFSKDFVLKGSFTDSMSGVETVEYTTDINAENATNWIPIEKDTDNGNFELTLGNGVYPAIAVRAVDAAGNISEPVCLKNEDGAFIQIIVNNIPPEINVSVMVREDTDTWRTYSAEDENWTNSELRFQVSEKDKSVKEAEPFATLHKVEYAYQSIASALVREPIGDDEWHELVIDEQGIAEFSLGGDFENPINKNGWYYFRGISGSGVKSKTNTEKRILLWQKMEDKKPVMESGADLGKRYNEWYNIASGTPVIDFEYPEYDTGVISGEYAAPITIHYNLNVKDEKNSITSLAENKTATIRADFSQNSSPTGFPLFYDDISQLQVKLSDDGIYTLEYWITDAAGNESETEIFTYKIDCHEPAGLKMVLDGEEQFIGRENVLIYDKFYQDSISGEVSAEYGISGEGSIKLLKAKKIEDWKDAALTEDAGHFKLEPNIRCLLYIKASDGAGNMTEGWTRGIVVDNDAPTGEGMPQLIVEPDGANKHGFFNKDVKVKISVKDAPYDGNSAGLKLVTASIGTAEGNTISDKELFSCTEESVSENLMGETESFSMIEIIDAKANEGNHAYITVNAKDRSENISTDMQEVKIDVTKPEIEITFDNENAVNGRYYNTDRRAKINIKELNFDASLVRLNVTRNGKDFTPPISEWQSDNNNHYAYVDFSADGDYTFSVECKDLADNKADKESAEPFTIDKTMPKVAIALESGNAQKEYFNEKQTVVITVTEHNFNADDFQIQMQPAGTVSSWEHKNDTHVIKVEFSSEGEYAISCDYKDLAGNVISNEDKSKMPLEFVIDLTNPVIEISGVEDNSANAEAVTPNITVRDVYADPTNVTITLATGRGIAVDISSDITTAFMDGGFLYTLNGLDAKPDDIYYLTVNAADKAGNVSELTYRFSLNRRGSAYDLTDLAKFRDNYYNSYKNFEDIKIIEMNVDRVEDFALYLSHNANLIYGKSGSRVLALDEHKLHEAVLYNVDVSGNENTGYVYTYTIYRENFAREGTYRLGVYSKDAAGNEVNNLLEQNGEEIQFVVDNTIPRVVIDGVENNEIYNVSSQEVRVVVDDNFKLAEAEITLVNQDGDILESWNYYDLVKSEGDTARIVIGEHNEEVSLLYRAVDAAGNEVRTLQGEKEAKSDFLVTTDKFVQLVNKPTQATVGRGVSVVSILSFAGIGLVFAILAFVIFKKLSRKKDHKKEKISSPDW